MRTSAFLSNQSAGAITVPEFGTPVASKKRRGWFNRDRVMSDNTMITVYPFDGQLYTYYESPFLHRVQPGSLETLGREELTSLGLVSHSAHPHWDRQGNMVTLGLRLGLRGPRYTVTQFRSGGRGGLAGRGRCLGEVPCSSALAPSYMHSFGLTSQWVVVVEQPLVVAIPCLLAALVRGRPTSTALQWREGGHTVIHLLNRVTGALHPVIYLASPFFFLHTINAYEDSGHVVLDLCCYPSPAMLDCMFLEELARGQANPRYARLFRGRPRRYVLPLGSGQESGQGMQGDLVTLDYTTASAFR